MRVNENPILPQNPDTPYQQSLNRTLVDIFRAIAQKVNQTADGRFAARDLTAASVPTTGMYAKGDFVANSNPVELGSVGSRFVVEGWLCLVGGTPGTFVEKRFTKGN